MLTLACLSAGQSRAIPASESTKSSRQDKIIAPVFFNGPNYFCSEPTAKRFFCLCWGRWASTLVMLFAKVVPWICFEPELLLIPEFSAITYNYVFGEKEEGYSCHAAFDFQALGSLEVSKCKLLQAKKHSLARVANKIAKRSRVAWPKPKLLLGPKLDPHKMNITKCSGTTANDVATPGPGKRKLSFVH